MVHENILSLIGNTPVIKLNKLSKDSSCQIYVKLEGFNPGGSHKVRVAVNMILEAEKEGILTRHSGQTIVEPTGGNTGIGLAMAGAVLGYKVVLVVPDNYSLEKQKILRAYGADVILSDSSKGQDSHIELVWELCSRANYVFLNQFTNDANVQIHKQNTAREICAVMDKIDYFVCGIGTGGSITGIAQTLRESFPGVKIVGVQPEGCDILNEKFIAHQIQGLAVGIRPPILDASLIDHMISVNLADSVTVLRRVAKEEGILLGLSSGAYIHAALLLAKQLNEAETILTISPDFGNSYLDYFE